MDGEHAEHVKHVKNSAESAGQGGLAANAPNTPKTPQKWSDLRRDEKAYIAAAAVKRFDAYVTEHGSKPYSSAVYLVADEVCRAVREGGITLPKRTMERHVLKILAKLAKGGSYFEMSTRRTMKK
jgi:hypothetical protein